MRLFAFLVAGRITLAFARKVDLDSLDITKNENGYSQHLCDDLDGSYYLERCYEYSGQVKLANLDDSGKVDATNCQGGCAIDGVCAIRAESTDCERANPDNLCPAPGIFLNASDCFTFNSLVKPTFDSEEMIDSDFCPVGCAKNGVCVLKAHDCSEAIRIRDSYHGSTELIYYACIIFVLLFALVGYCFCIRETKDDDDDDDFRTVGKDGQVPKPHNTMTSSD